MQPTVLVITDCEPDDLWALKLLLRHTNKQVIVGITSPNPSKHKQQLLSLFPSLEVYEGSTYSRKGMTNTDNELRRIITKLLDQAEPNSIDLVVLTTPVDVDITDPSKIRTCYVSGGTNMKGELAFNFRIDPMSAQQLLDQVPVHLNTSRFYQSSFGFSINSETMPNFIQTLKDKCESVRDLQQLMYKFDMKNKFLEDKDKGWQLCPADIYTMMSYLFPDIVEYDDDQLEVKSFDWKQCEEYMIKLLD